MRLIDADSLKSKICDQDCQNCAGQDYGRCMYNLNKETIIDFIDFERTVEPVKRGSWEVSFPTWVCDQCGGFAPCKAQNWQPIPYKSDYCPQCGADMREQVDE